MPPSTGVAAARTLSRFVSPTSQNGSRISVVPANPVPGRRLRAVGATKRRVASWARSGWAQTQATTARAQSVLERAGIGASLPVYEASSPAPFLAGVILAGAETRPSA